MQRRDGRVDCERPRLVEAQRGVFEVLARQTQLDCRVGTRAAVPACRISPIVRDGPEPEWFFRGAFFDGTAVKARRSTVRPTADAEPATQHPLHALSAVQARTSTAMRTIKIIDPRVWPARFATFQEEEWVHSLISGTDGRLPVGSIKKRRLPFQVAAVGQPAGGRTPLHAVLRRAATSPAWIKGRSPNGPRARS